MTTRDTASNAARHSTGHLTVDSMVDSPRGNPRHTAHAKLLTRFRASSRPDSQHQQAPRPPLHPAPARNRQRHRDVASILLDDRYRLVESTSRYADARWSALWLMRFFGRLLVIIYNRTSVDESTRSRSRPRAVGGAPCADHVVGRSPAPVLTSFYPLFPARAGNNSVSFGLWRRTIYVQLYARRRGGDAGRAGN